MLFSDALSNAEVASSIRIIGASFRIALAIAIRWRSPPDKFLPPS